MISLVLATIGRTDDLARVFVSLNDQTYRDFEVLVIDQNDDDRLVPIVEMGRQDGLMIRHIKQKVPGLSQARNLGIEQANGELVAFPDDDCWYDSNVLEAIYSRFLSMPHVGGFVGQWVERNVALKAPIRTGPLMLERWRDFRGGDASSITLFFRRDLLIRISGFDERFGVGKWFGSAEETDLILRALSNKEVIEYAEEVKVHHRFNLQSPVGGHQILANLRSRARGTGALYSKHNLGFITIIRGFLAPLVIPLLRCDVDGVLRGIAVVVGRLEGYLSWRLRVKS